MFDLLLVRVGFRGVQKKKKEGKKRIELFCIPLVSNSIDSTAAVLGKTTGHISQYQGFNVGKTILNLGICSTANEYREKREGNVKVLSNRTHFSPSPVDPVYIYVTKIEGTWKRKKKEEKTVQGKKRNTQHTERPRERSWEEKKGKWHTRLKEEDEESKKTNIASCEFNVAWKHAS